MAIGHILCQNRTSTTPSTPGCPRKSDYPGFPKPGQTQKVTGDGRSLAQEVTASSEQWLSHLSRRSPWKEREREKKRKREKKERPTGPTAPHYLCLYPVETPEPQDLPTSQLHLSVVDLIHVLWQLFLWNLLLGDAVPSFLQELQVAGRDCADQLGRGRESSSAETPRTSGKQGGSKESTVASPLLVWGWDGAPPSPASNKENLGRI